MEITDIKIFRAGQKAPVLAYANVILNRRFIIRGITLLENENGRFISMPSRKLKNGERKYREVCHPINSNVRRELTQLIFSAYDEFMENEALEQY